MPYTPDANSIVLQPVMIRADGFRNRKLRCLAVRSAPNYVGKHITDYALEIQPDMLLELVAVGCKIEILEPDYEIVSAWEYCAIMERSNDH